MEDRRTGGLYLERCDLSPHDYARRAGDLAALPGVDRVTWWAVQVPDRDDVPRRLREFSLLGVSEVGAGFEAPDAPEGGETYLFRSTPRPGQGSLTGEPTLGLLLVLISPRTPDRARALRDWADFVHIRHIAEAAVPGYGMITPYENATGGEPRFLHFYEMHTDDPEAAYRTMTPLVSDRIGRPGSPEFDDWAWCPDLWIEYVNTFALLGEHAPGPATRPA